MAGKRLILAAALALAAMPAMAQNQSAYTGVNLETDCQQMPPDPDDELGGGEWWCTGHAGMPVRITEGDLRFFVSFGPDAANEMAAGETFPAFNTLGETMEWRLAPGPGGVLVPIATILRWFTDPGDGGPKGQYLVITKLGGPGQICRVGTVDALLNPDANQVARDVADNAAPGFVCGQENALAFGLSGDDAME